MKPVFLKNNQIDRKRWDEMVSNFGDGNFYCYSWYLDVICKDWNALVLGDYEYILPVPTKNKGFFRIAYQPFFSRQLAIIGKGQLNNTLLQRFISALPKTYGQVMIGLQYLETTEVPGYSVLKYPYQALELEGSIEDIRKAYSENARRIVKKLNASGILYKEIHPKVVVDLFASETAAKLEYIKANDLIILQRLCEECIKHNFGQAVGAFNTEGKLLAAGFFVSTEKSINYLKGSSTEAGKDNGAMYGLMDHLISSNLDSKKVFDFGGSRIPSIATFFKKFGANDRYYSFLQKDQPFFIHLGKQLYHKLSR